MGHMIFLDKERTMYMETYSVKQIADMLNTKPETVRRWIRTGKLSAEQSSRKNGNVINEKDLQKFLKSSPKYAGVFAGVTVGTLTSPLATIPLVGGMAASYLLTAAKGKKKTDSSFSKESIKKYLKEEIERRTKSLEQKKMTIDHIRLEMENDQKQLVECEYLLKKLEEE